MRIKVTTKLLWTDDQSHVFSRIWHYNDKSSPFYVPNGEYEGYTILPSKGMEILFQLSVAYSIRAVVQEISTDDLGIVIVLECIIVLVDDFEHPEFSDVAIAETLMWPMEATD